MYWLLLLIIYVLAVTVNYSSATANGLYANSNNYIAFVTRPLFCFGLPGDNTRISSISEVPLLIKCTGNSLVHQVYRKFPCSSSLLEVPLHARILMGMRTVNSNNNNT